MALLLNGRILLDSGSHRSYITERLAKKLKISSTKSEAISIVTFGADRPKSVQTKVSEVTLLMKNGSKKTLSVNIVPKITGSISRTPVNIDASNFLWKDIPLADTLPKEAEVTSIDCLIGSDYYLELVTSERIQVREGLYLLESELGWILTGRTGEHSDEVDASLLIITHTNNSVPHLCRQPTLDTCLQVSPSMEDFWSLESIGIKDLPERSDDERALQTFESTVNVHDGRYYVSWPWKDNFADLPDNYALAYGRFRSTVRRLSQDEGLLQKYSQIIQDQEEKGVVEKVTKTDDNTESTLKHYIPHHPVITPKKVRIVYDASAKTKRSDKSLNECLLRGPVILQNLCGLLLRFRLHKVAILADIEKAFLQIGLNSFDRDVTRFFWLKDPRKPEVKDNIQLYRFCRVPFGVISSPFLLAATVSHHLSRTHSPLAVDLCRNIYVDNVVSGVPDDSSALSFYKEAKNLMRQASMNLREWTSNSSAFLKYLPAKDKIESDTAKVLGLNWNVKTDKLQMIINTTDDENSAITRRRVMREMARCFDPLGFFVPVTLAAKLFVQTLWDEPLDWDQPLSAEDEEQWREISNELNKLPFLRMKRYIAVREGNLCNLLCFCDASQHAFATVVYLHYQLGCQWHSALIFAKSRVAPKRKLSIPRLELMGVLIGVRCLRFAEEQLDLKISRKFLWTDSKCVLYWLKSKKSLCTFVANRVIEIQRGEDIAFRYVRTTENPADIATKIQKAEDPSTNNLWWRGPVWIRYGPGEWPKYDFGEISPEELKAASAEVKGSKVLFESGLNAAESPSSGRPFIMDETRYSSLRRLLRVTAWILRFLRKLGLAFSEASMNAGNTKYSSCVTSEEVERAKTVWERHIQSVFFSEVLKGLKDENPTNLQRQLGLAMDNNGVVRCHGRFANSDLPENMKFPKLLPTKSHFTRLVIDSCHKKLLHSGVSYALPDKTGILDSQRKVPGQICYLSMFGLPKG